VSYTDLDQLTDRFGSKMLVNLTDRSDPRTDAVDTDIVDRALADTQAVIDGHLVGKYALPITDVPPLIAELAATIAIYKLHIYTPDEKIGDDYKQALRSLESIAKGTIKLSIEGAPAAAGQSSGARLTDRKRPMTAANMTGFI
jgi:phage gp36-like protein